MMTPEKAHEQSDEVVVHDVFEECIQAFIAEATPICQAILDDNVVVTGSVQHFIHENQYRVEIAKFILCLDTQPGHDIAHRTETLNLIVSIVARGIGEKLREAKHYSGSVVQTRRIGDHLVGQFVIACKDQRDAPASVMEA